jgi:hypothetical protein
MKTAYFINIGFFVAGGLFYFLTSCGDKKPRNNPKTIPEETTKQKTIEIKENAFVGLRNMAFSRTPEQLKLSLPTNKTIVYGIVMDWEINGAIATIVSYQTGDASLYLSTGGGVIGGGQHENVSSAAKHFVSLGQSFLDKAKKTEKTTLPETGVIKFYLLTNKGIFVDQEQMKNFENRSSTWLSLFDHANILLTELQKTAEK